MPFSLLRRARRARRVRVIIIVLRVAVFFALLEAMLWLLSLGYDVATAVGVLVVVVGLAVRVAVRLVSDPQLRAV